MVEVYDGFWKRFRDDRGRAYGDAELVEALAGVDKGATRNGVLQNETGVQRGAETIRWNAELAGEHGYVSTAGWVGDDDAGKEEKLLQPGGRPTSSSYSSLKDVGQPEGLPGSRTEVS